MKDSSKITVGWLLNDLKALGLIARGISLEHHTKSRSGTSALHAWNARNDFYNRKTLHNRVSMTRRLHDFKMKDGMTMSKHLDSFDEVVVGLQTLNEPLDETQKLVILLSSLPEEYELISSIVESSNDTTLFEV